MPEISVLIPVYNGQETIKKTINSVLEQTFSDFELILVNDGSNDDTETIIKDFKDKRIRYFYKENKGIADTRNFALSKAEGKYIAFIDADDWMEKTALELLIKKARETQAEIVVCDYRYVYENGTTHDMHSTDFKITSVANHKSLLVEVMPQPWNKLVKKEVFDNSKLSFPTGLVFEDLCFYSCLMPSIKSIVKLNEVLINYYQVGTSIMASAKKIRKTTYDFDTVIARIDQHYKEHYDSVYQKELEGLFALNARELIDGIFKNKVSENTEKILVIHSILNTINKNYPAWYKNSYYTRKYAKYKKSFRIKRRVIDWLLAKGEIKLVVERIIK